MSRKLYLLCYDIRQSKRRSKIHKTVSAYAVNGQKSAFECWLTATEKTALIHKLVQHLNNKEDQLGLIVIDPKAPCKTLGIADDVTAPLFFYAG